MGNNTFPVPAKKKYTKNYFYAKVCSELFEIDVNAFELNLCLETHLLLKNADNSSASKLDHKQNKYSVCKD